MKRTFSHLDNKGRAHMVDVGRKPAQARRAKAEASLECDAETIKLIREKALPKGDVLVVAQIAGIQAAKRTSELIPLCHGLPLDHVDVHFKLKKNQIHVIAEASTTAKTGVEMEALTAVSVAALTLYDMCKAVDKTMVITGIRLLKKTKQ